MPILNEHTKHAAVEITSQLRARWNVAIDHEMKAMVERLIATALGKTLDELAPTQDPPLGTLVHHVHAPPLGSVDHKLTHSTTGISLETDVTRPRQDGETFEQAAQASAALVASAYRQAIVALEKHAVALGPFKKAAP